MNNMRGRRWRETKTERSARKNKDRRRAREEIPFVWSGNRKRKGEGETNGGLDKTECVSESCDGRRCGAQRRESTQQINLQTPGSMKDLSHTLRRKREEPQKTNKHTFLEKGPRDAKGNEKTGKL